MVSSLSPWGTGSRRRCPGSHQGNKYLTGKSVVYLDLWTTVDGNKERSGSPSSTALGVGLAVRLCDPGPAPLTVRPMDPTDFPSARVSLGAGSLAWRDGGRRRSCQEVATHVKAPLKNGKQA